MLQKKHCVGRKQGSTDAARAASDIVLTESGLAVIIRAIVVSRQIVQRMKNYLIYRIACTMQLLLFFFISALFVSPSGYHQVCAPNVRSPFGPVHFRRCLSSPALVCVPSTRPADCTSV